MKLEIAIRLMTAIVVTAIYIYFLGWKTILLKMAIDIALSVVIVAVGLVCVGLILLHQKLCGKQGVG